MFLTFKSAVSLLDLHTLCLDTPLPPFSLPSHKLFLKCETPESLLVSLCGGNWDLYRYLRPGISYSSFTEMEITKNKNPWARL